MFLLTYEKAKETILAQAAYMADVRGEMEQLRSDKDYWYARVAEAESTLKAITEILAGFGEVMDIDIHAIKDIKNSVDEYNAKRKEGF